MRNFLNYNFFVFLPTIYRISKAKFKARKIGKKMILNFIHIFILNILKLN